jgi:hypothetical protein
LKVSAIIENSRLNSIERRNQKQQLWWQFSDRKEERGSE